MAIHYLKTNEQYTITLSLPAGIPLATIPTPSVTGTIPNDDMKPTVSIADARGAEGDGTTNGSVEFTVTLSAAAGVLVTVNYATSDGTAKAPEPGTVDYIKELSGVLEIPASNNSGTTNISRTISIDTKADDIPEIDETFNVVLTLPPNSNVNPGLKTTAIGTIDIG